MSFKRTAFQRRKQQNNFAIDKLLTGSVAEYSFAVCIACTGSLRLVSRLLRNTIGANAIFIFMLNQFDRAVITQQITDYRNDSGERLSKGSQSLGGTREEGGGQDGVYVFWLWPAQTTQPQTDAKKLPVQLKILPETPNNCRTLIENPLQARL